VLPARRLREVLVHGAVMADPERLALDQEREARLTSPRAGDLVVLEEARPLRRVGAPVDPPGDRRGGLESRLEPLTGAAEGRRLFAEDLGLDELVRLLGAGDLSRGPRGRRAAWVA